MTITQSIVLGIIQGITEFLPISSSGHLILIPSLFNWKLQELSFDVMLHAGTALALLVVFAKDWVKLAKSAIYQLKTRKESAKNVYTDTLRRDFQLLCNIILFTIPVGLAGLLLEKSLKDFFRSPQSVAIMLILASLFMALANYLYNKKLRAGLLKDSITLPIVAIVALSQILALIPGTSRSGVTIATAFILGLPAELATKLSFMLALPIITAAVIFESKDILALQTFEIPTFLAGFLASFTTGLIALKWLLNFVKSQGLWVFIIYRICLGVVILFYFI